MKKLLQDSFKILRNNLLFIQPLLLYLLMIMLASTYFVSGHVALYPKMLLAVSMILLTVAFFAGWMYINKKGIDDYVEEDSAEEISIKAIKNFKLFFSGVGEYFFRVLKGFLCFGVLYAACFFFFKKLGKTIFANPVLINELNKIAAVKTNEELTSLLTTFKPEDIMVLELWIISIALFVSFLNFLFVLYLASLFYKKENVIKSLFKTLLLFFKNIFKCILVVIFLLVIYFIIGLLTAFSGQNPLAFAILILIMTLYLNYYVILVFCFYNERTKTNSNSGTECIGQDTYIS